MGWRCVGIQLGCEKVGNGCGMLDLKGNGRDWSLR